MQYDQSYKNVSKCREFLVSVLGSLIAPLYLDEYWWYPIARYAEKSSTMNANYLVYVLCFERLNTTHYSCYCITLVLETTLNKHRAYTKLLLAFLRALVR